jgi:hypothetical protein
MQEFLSSASLHIDHHPLHSHPSSDSKYIYQYFSQRNNLKIEDPEK